MIQKVITVLLTIGMILLFSFISGCNTGVTVTAESSLFYPDIETSEGGKFKDPGGRGKGLGFTSGSAPSDTFSVGFGN
jgi:hypothetical protein